MDHPAQDTKLNPEKMHPGKAEGQTYNNEHDGHTATQEATRNALTTGPILTLAAWCDYFAPTGLEPSGSPCGEYTFGGGTHPTTP